MTKPIVINRKPLNQSIGREGMSRSLFLSILCAGFFLNIAVANAGGTQAIDTRPNILFILLDDLGKEWVSAYGAEEIKTPNIDAMAAHGVRFTDFYARHKCSPSRASLMSGAFNFRVGIGSIVHPHSSTGMCKETVTIPEMLKEKGYNRTMSLELFNAELWEQDPVEMIAVGLERMKQLWNDD